MRVPTKQQLYDQIAALERANQKAVEERQREEEQRWKKLLPIAFAMCRKMLNAIFPNTVTLLRFEHVDRSGYWFTYQLINDPRRQTYAVRHDEVIKEIYE